MLRRACEQAQAWASQGVIALPVAVNVSARQFREEVLIQSVSKALAETGLDPHLLEIELTEGLLLRNTELGRQIMEQLKAMGCNVYIDDFGTGYASISYLRAFPIYALKIDQSLIRGLASEPDDAAIVKAIIDLAHGLRLSVTAEGVELPDQLQILRTLGCDEIQGYLVSPPLPALELVKWLKSSAYGPRSLIPTAIH